MPVCVTDELAEVAAAHGLQEADLGTIDSEVFLGFVWHLAGRPVDAPDTWHLYYGDQQGTPAEVKVVESSIRRERNRFDRRLRRTARPESLRCAGSRW